MKIFNNIKTFIKLIYSLDDRLHSIQKSIGRIEGRQLNVKTNKYFNDFEFQVYSQWGEDGLIQHLVKSVAIERPIFVEFGVENYTECNTRFLLQNNNWTGLIIDGSEQHIRSIRSNSIYWRHNLKAECAFINIDNINGILQSNRITGDIGLLSIDIDGNDYWVWEAVSVVNPRIVICEYNSLWGASFAVSTPYDSNFVRERAHFSGLYYGASIAALTSLADRKGYSLVGSNSAGNNAFFVRNDLLNMLVVRTPADAWIRSEFRESRNEGGQLTYLSFDDRLKLLSDLPLVNVIDGTNRKIGELYGHN